MGVLFFVNSRNGGDNVKERLSVLVILLAVSLGGCTADFAKPKLEDVASVSLVGPCTGATCGKSYLLTLDNPRDAQIINKILNWVDTSETVGDAKHEMVLMGGSPRKLEISLRNGQTLYIQPAIDAVGRKIPNGYEEKGVAVMDQLTVYQIGRKPIRILSRDLKAWLEGKWESDISKC